MGVATPQKGHVHFVRNVDGLQPRDESRSPPRGEVRIAQSDSRYLV